VTPRLLQHAAARILGAEDAAAIRSALDAWDPRSDRDAPVRDLTNGAESFEAALWAANAAQDGKCRDDAALPDPGLVARIAANCRQLREAAIVLEKEFSSGRN